MSSPWGLLVLYAYCNSFLEKAMATHSSTLAWKIPWTEEPGSLQSMGLLRVGHNWATPLSLSLFTFLHWRRKWQPTPVFLPGESQGWGSLVGCCLWDRTELDTTEATAARQLLPRDSEDLDIIHNLSGIPEDPGPCYGICPVCCIC